MIVSIIVLTRFDAHATWAHDHHPKQNSPDHKLTTTTMDITPQNSERKDT